MINETAKKLRAMRHHVVSFNDRAVVLEGICELEKQQETIAKLKRRPSVATHNALQEECDGRMIVIKRLTACIDELNESLKWVYDNSTEQHITRMIWNKVYEHSEINRTRLSTDSEVSNG